MSGNRHLFLFYFRFSLDFAFLCDILCADKAEKSRNNDNRRKDKKVWSTFSSNNPGKRESDKYYLYPHQVPEDFRPWLDDQWYDLPDVITPKDVETVLGYEHESVRRWINRGWLQITKAHNAEIVPRQWLIDFTCDYAFRIARKSNTHRELLDKYFG